MNTKIPLAISAFCLMTGCYSAVDDDPGVSELNTPEQPGPEQPSPEQPSLEQPIPQPAADGTLIDGMVWGSFPLTDGGECGPFGMPITFFLTGVFGPDALVSETAKPVSATQCVHEQVLEASADAWALLAYNTICLGGGDSSLCGAQATRLCSLNLILQWAKERTESVAVSDSTLGFTYVLDPQGEAARTALYERALQEVDALIAESTEILSDQSDGTRACPNENYDEIRAIVIDAQNVRQGILHHLNGA